MDNNQRYYRSDCEGKGPEPKEIREYFSECDGILDLALYIMRDEGRCIYLDSSNIEYLGIEKKCINLSARASPQYRESRKMVFSRLERSYNYI